MSFHTPDALPQAIYNEGFYADCEELALDTEVMANSGFEAGCQELILKNVFAPINLGMVNDSLWGQARGWHVSKRK